MLLVLLFCWFCLCLCWSCVDGACDINKVVGLFSLSFAVDVYVIVCVVCVCVGCVVGFSLFL